jgi:hypothetical protein
MHLIAGLTSKDLEMEFLNGIFSRGFWTETRVFLDSSFWVSSLIFPFYKMLFMNRLKFSCSVDFFVRILKNSEEYNFFIRHMKGL